MEKKFNIKSKSITVKVNEKGRTPKHGECGTCFKYEVEVLVEGRRYLSFRCEYLGSADDYMKNKAFDKKDINHVFECILGDALAYMQSYDIDEFADNIFGNGAKVSKVIEVYGKCEDIAHWLMSVGITETDICEYLNSLNDE